MLTVVLILVAYPCYQLLNMIITYPDSVRMNSLRRPNSTCSYMSRTAPMKRKGVKRRRSLETNLVVRCDWIVVLDNVGAGWRDRLIHGETGDRAR